MSEPPDIERSYSYFTTPGGSSGGGSPKISLFDQFKAVITLDKKFLKLIPYVQDAKVNAIVLIYLCAILEVIGVIGFDFRLYISNSNPFFQFFILQPLFLLLVALIFKIALSLHGIEIDTNSVFIMIGYAHIWTILSGFIFFAISDSVLVGTLLFIIFNILYLSPVILAFVEGHTSRYFAIGFTMNVLFFLSFFVITIPVLFLFSH